MGLPVVAIVGRPNVGKSSLLNALAGKRISIVEPTAGVTRDRVSTVLEYRDLYFELVDTGGYGLVDRQELAEHIEDQIRQAIAMASLVVFMVDVREGLTPLDEQIARLLRRTGVDVIGVANKADEAKFARGAYEFMELGFSEFLCVSATNNLNTSELLEQIQARLKETGTEKPAEPVMKLAVVGKRNAGKSTFVNAMVGSDRVVVDAEPGTTRDAVDVQFEHDGRPMVLIDTAGMRRMKSIKDSIEFYSAVRSEQAIRRADVVVLMIDAAEPVSQVDKKIARMIQEKFKACVLVVNKWDLAREQTVTEDYEAYLGKTLPGLRDAPLVFTVATDGEKVMDVLDVAEELYAQATYKIPTAKLNKAMELIRAERPAGKGRPKVYYATQVATNPVTVLLFVNDVRLFDQNYRKFVAGRLKEHLPIAEVPVRLLLRRHRT
jgi:GTP-binding protein